MTSEISTAKVDRGPRDRDFKFWTATDRDRDREPHDRDRDRVTTSAIECVLITEKIEFQITIIMIETITFSNFFFNGSFFT